MKKDVKVVYVGVLYLLFGDIEMKIVMMWLVYLIFSGVVMF